jgi:hypothetical protein
MKHRTGFAFLTAVLLAGGSAAGPTAEPTAEPDFEAASGFGPMPEVRTPARVAGPKGLRRPRPAPKVLARAVPAEPEPLSFAEGEEMRMAVGPLPAPPAMPRPAMSALKGAPPTGTPDGTQPPRPPGRPTEAQQVALLLVVATALLAGFELRRHLNQD